MQVEIIRRLEKGTAQRVWSLKYSSTSIRSSLYTFKQAPTPSCRGSNQMAEMTKKIHNHGSPTSKRKQRQSDFILTIQD